MPTPPDHPLSLTPEAVFKEDRRSKVWRIRDAQEQSWVVKLFLHASWRQRLTAMLGLHPAQHEAAWHERLAMAGLPVVPIVAAGADERGRRWLLTPYVGVSLYNWLRHCDPTHDVAKRHDFTRQLGRLTGQFIAQRLSHRDHKASNIVVDEDGKLSLIDAGAVRGAKGVPRLALALPMLKNLHDNLADAVTYHEQPDRVAITRSDRMRFYRAMCGVWDKLPDGLQHLPRSEEFG